MWLAAYDMKYYEIANDSAKFCFSPILYNLGHTVQWVKENFRTWDCKLKLDRLKKSTQISLPTSGKCTKDHTIM